MQSLAKTTLLLALTLAAPGLARELTGQVALPAEAPGDRVLVVEVLAPEGVEATVEAPGTAGQPAAFRATARDVPLLVRGVLRAGGQVWTTDPVHVGAGTGDVDLGTLTPETRLPPVQGNVLACGTEVIEILMRDGNAVLRRAGETATLPPATAASGALFQDGTTSLHSRGDRALVTWRGTVFAACAPLMPATATFRGHQPGWTLSLAPAGAVLLREGAAPLRSAGQMTRLAPGALRIDMPGLPSLAVSPGPCRDAVTGMPHPLAISLGEEIGCGGDPLVLMAGDWRAVEVAGAALPASAAVTLSFAADAVTGAAGCNRYRAATTLTVEGLTIAPGVATRMACPDMASEQAFIAALAAVTRFDIGPDGALVLLAGDTPVIRARR